MNLQLKIPPPIVMVITGACMWLIARAFPQFAFDFPQRPLLMMLVAILGVITLMFGVQAFRRAQTTVNPLHPDKASALVTSGIYRFTRNPMYLGILLILTAWALYRANYLAFVFLPVFILYITVNQILPEERALLTLFGDQFTAYKSRVRRWI